MEAQPEAGSKEVSFSKVEYSEVASFVGLNPMAKFHDAPLFDLRRSRITARLFETIVVDMDAKLSQYGDLQHQYTEESRSRFFAPIFKRLGDEFGGWFRVTPETLKTGRITTKGRVEYQLIAFDILAVLVVEVKLPLKEDHLDAIAQVIAECDGCDKQNNDIRIPIYVILCDGNGFQFFSFDGATEPWTFSVGVFPGSHFEQGRGLGIPDFSSSPTALPFILSLRVVCETIFNLLLLTYIATLKKLREIGPPNVVAWDRAVTLAERALEMSQGAEAHRRDDSIDNSEAMAQAALDTLNSSVCMIPRTFRTRPLMDSWDDDAVAWA